MERSEFYREARRDLPGPLAGVRVVEVTTTWAGPMCGCVLADFGADVIKVEHPAARWRAARRRSCPARDPPLSFMHATVNRNKRSLSPRPAPARRGRDLFLRLAATADVVVENFRPGTLDALRPRLRDVRARASPTWSTSRSAASASSGRDAERAGYDPLAQAASGFLSLNGSPTASR